MAVTSLDLDRDLIKSLKVALGNPGMTTKKAVTTAIEEIVMSRRHRDILVSLSDLSYAEDDFGKEKIDYEVDE